MPKRKQSPLERVLRASHDPDDMAVLADLLEEAGEPARECLVWRRSGDTRRALEALWADPLLRLFGEGLAALPRGRRIRKLWLGGDSFRPGGGPRFRLRARVCPCLVPTQLRLVYPGGGDGTLVAAWNLWRSRLADPRYRRRKALDIAEAWVNYEASRRTPFRARMTENPS